MYLKSLLRILVHSQRRDSNVNIVVGIDCGAGKNERLVPHMMQLNPLGLGSSGRLYGSHFGVLLRPHNGTYKKASCNTSRKSNNCISATARPMDVDVDGGSSVGTDANNLVEAGVSWFDAFYRFSRPHTIIGSVSYS